jgi:hypothetical protein
MSIPAPKVEIGFDLVGPGAPFLTLDDPVRGLLDNTEWLLAGEIFYDVTDRMVEISVNRGKNRQLDVYDPGLASVVLQNNDRLFDPTYTASPFFGQIIPKRAIRISSGDQLQFVGVIDDWNLSYSPNGQSLVSVSCSDAFSYFIEQSILSPTTAVQSSGARINAVLDLPEVNWPADRRQIDTGAQELVDADIPDNANVLRYLQQVTASEPGSFFISRQGNAVFEDRRNAGATGSVILSDDGTGVPYVGMRIQYGSELLYNEIVVSSPAGTAIATDPQSQGEFGIFNLTQSDLLINQLADLESLAQFYSNKYARPEYRFESVEILLDELTPTQQQQLIDLELTDVVQIKFTPNGIPPAIERYAEIIRIDHAITTTSHVISLGFATLDSALFVLDDPQFGKLDAGNALAF